MRKISEARSISGARILGLCICLLIGVMILLAGVAYFSYSPGWRILGEWAIKLGLMIILYVVFIGIVLWGGFFGGRRRIVEKIMLIGGLCILVFGIYVWMLFPRLN